MPRTTPFHAIFMLERLSGLEQKHLPSLGQTRRPYGSYLTNSQVVSLLVLAILGNICDHNMTTIVTKIPRRGGRPFLPVAKNTRGKHLLL